jgi:hypothetical protein
VKTYKMSPIAPGNPFLSDPFNMGTIIGSNVAVMYGKHTTEHQRYIIIVDTLTGERRYIDLDAPVLHAGEGK